MNRTMLLLGAAALTTTALPTAAQAAGPAGARVEVFLGYDASDLDFEDDEYSLSLNNKGIFYGIGAGYDFPLSDKSSIGADIEISDSTADDSRDNNQFKLRDDFGVDFYVGGRLSYAVMDRATLYLKAGYTNLRLNASLDACLFDIVNGSENLSSQRIGCTFREVFDDSDSVDGFRVGGGVDVALFGRTYTGVEYRFSSYDDEINRQQLMVKLGMRF